MTRNMSGCPFGENEADMKAILLAAGGTPQNEGETRWLGPEVLGLGMRKTIKIHKEHTPMDDDQDFPEISPAAWYIDETQRIEGAGTMALLAKLAKECGGQELDLRQLKKFTELRYDQKASLEAAIDSAFNPADGSWLAQLVERLVFGQQVEAPARRPAGRRM